ncbi:MAG TPA: tRNA glutamyl-Q(34) synthetase GluQRS [Deltaproteobacteria bacterium]|nr:tRNA glutamyl-Q(34) synthetase GluQRS [Deltaproteobacteria bacterium]
MGTAPTVGRLAPTPSGHLHLGNVVAFAAAWLSVRSASGRLLLRLEDVDRIRSRTDVIDSIRDDLRWMGLLWDEEVLPQRLRDYAPWLDRLRAHTYACTCTRKQIGAAGGVYPGTCRDAGHTEGAIRFALPQGEVPVVDRRFGIRRVDPNTFGDPVLRRRDGVYTYNLAVVADDLLDGVTEVVRGADLLDYTAVQIHLWRALGATQPTWLHAPLILGPDGRKLSKSTASTEIRALRAMGWTPGELWRTVLPWLGLPPLDHIHDAIDSYDPARSLPGPIALEDPPDRPARRRPTSRGWPSPR